MCNKNEIHETVRKFWTAQEAYYKLLVKIKQEELYAEIQASQGRGETYSVRYGQEHTVVYN